MIRSLLTAGLSSFVLLAASAQAQTQPRLVPSPVEKVFVPQGFDDNDNAEVVLHGHFPNSCYKTGPVKASLGADGKTIVVEAMSYYYGGVGCAQVLVPFQQVASLGLMAEGTFAIQIKGQPEVPARALEVAHARTQSPDDYLYAPVDAASLELDGGETMLEIAGTYPYMFIGCMVINEIRTSVTPDKVVVVQPITEIRDDADCADVPQSFKLTKDLGALDAAEYLIHVRTLNGNALNRLVDLTEREGLR